MKISFDFDCTLGEDKIQKLANIIKTSNSENDVYVVTSRNAGQSYNQDLWKVAKRLNIPNERVFFTEGAWKWKKINELEMDMHFDDVPEECELIAINTKCLPILLWDEYCKGSIKCENFGKGIY